MLGYVALGILMLAVVAWVAAAARAHAFTRGVRAVHCPTTGHTASVHLLPARPLTLRGPVGLMVADCSLWPESGHCAQACLAEIESSPQHCAFRHVLAAWYRGQRCAFCGREMPEVHWGDLRPALRAPDGHIVAWSEIPPAQLYETLATHRAVCASCDVAETFRHRHADWVVERPRDHDHPGPPPAA